LLNLYSVGTRALDEGGRYIKRSDKSTTNKVATEQRQTETRAVVAERDDETSILRWRCDTEMRGGITIIIEPG